MRKTMYKSVLAVIATGLLSVGMATAETVYTPDTTDKSEPTKTLTLGHNFKNVEPRTDSLQWHFHDWPIENTKKAHTFKGHLIEAAKRQQSSFHMRLRHLVISLMVMKSIQCGKTKMMY